MTFRKLIVPIAAAAAIAASPPQAVAQRFTTYHCRDGTEFVVAFFDRDRVAHVQLDGKAVGLRPRLAFSGARYAQGDITLRITKAATILRRGGRSTDCSAG